MTESVQLLTFELSSGLDLGVVEFQPPTGLHAKHEAHLKKNAGKGVESAKKFGWNWLEQPRKKVISLGLSTETTAPFPAAFRNEFCQLSSLSS